MANRDEQPTCRSRRHAAGEAPLLAHDLCVCTSCRDVAEETLIELPSLFEMCAYALDLRPNGLRERVSGHRPRGIILRDAVVSVRSEILGVLASWCGLVTTERGVPGPDELAIRKLIGFLGIHLHWLCQHPVAPDLVDELVELTASASDALRPGTGFRIAVGTCLRAGCGRPVYAEAHREGDEPYEVSCEAGHVWAPEHWLSLRGRRSGPNGTGHQNGTPAGTPAGSQNGGVNGGSGGGVNGGAGAGPNGSPNGAANGHHNGNGHANGHVNGHTNGHANGHQDGVGGTGHQNGFSNGLANGRRNTGRREGGANGHVNGSARSRPASSEGTE